MKIVLISALGIGGATFIGSLFGFIFNDISKKISNLILSFAAGVMLSTSIFNLLIPSMENDNKLSLFITVIGFLFGALIINVLDFIVNRLIKKSKKIKVNELYDENNVQAVLLFVTAVAIHNLPEGLAAGVGFGTGNISDALVIAGSIALQNFPEGMVIIGPMLSAGISRLKVLIIGIITGLIEIIGTVLGYYAVTFSTGILPFALSFAGGTMIFVICSDMIPDTKCDNNYSSTYSLIFGFCLMLVFNELI